MIDNEGFSYPVVNKEQCVDCGLCERVCPCLNQNVPRHPLMVNATRSSDENVRSKSSSGGLFTMFAETVIADGGVVFGARFDKNWNVLHDYTEVLDGLNAFRGSKYVQSYIGETYKQAREFLMNGRKVLFSGTPCQIAGLKKYLHKEYDTLLTIEVVCHGVPSPIVWKSYLEYINPLHMPITNINLRDKSRGWKRYSYLIESNDSKLVDDYAASSLYLKGFSLNLTLRPSCYKCPAKEQKSGADITLADCWGVENLEGYMDDNKGVSTVIINTAKAKVLFNRLNTKKHAIDYCFVKRYNPSIVHSTKEPYCRKTFWRVFPKYGIQAVDMVINRLNNPIYRIYNKFRTKIQK